MTEEIKIKIKPELDTAALKQSADQMKKTLNDAVNTDKVTKSTKGTTDQVNELKGAIDKLTTVTGFSALTNSLKGVKTVVKGVVNDVKLAAEEFKGAFNFKNFDVGDDGLKGYLQSMKIQFKEAGKSISGVFAPALKVARNAAIGLIGTMAALTAIFNKFTESTKEFRQAMNQLNTSFTALGSNAAMGTKAYEGFYRILGEVDRSTEAANLLAQITTNEKDLTTWTQIATGALAMFPDSLPTESLIEASNETIKTAKVTGVLADALNWPANSAKKISEALKGSTEAQKIFNKAIAQGMTVEDSMNEVLAATNNEIQREVILRAALNGVYAESAGLYEQVNADIIAQNEAQNRLNQALARIGTITQSVTTAWINFKTVILEAVTPAIQTLCSWIVTAINWVAALIAVLFPGTESISAAVEGVSSSMNSAAGGSGAIADNLDTATASANKLRRTLMGFDELNVLSNPNSSGGSGSGSGSGGGGASGGGIDVSGIDTGESIFSKAKGQFEEFKEKISAFMEKWEPQIKTIGALLAALGISKLLGHLGDAIGLGGKFLGVMQTISKLAVTGITIVLQYSLVNEFLDKFIDGEGIKNYLLAAVVSAIGTGILYSMWGPAGLVIGLGVTAVASFKALWDNGGITNIESFVVALTGIGTAIGAVVAAVKVFNLGTVLKDVGAFFALLKEGNGLVPTLAAAFPKLSTAIGSVVSGLSGFLGSIGAVFGATGTGAVVAGAGVIAAAIAAIVSVVVFLKEHWDELGNTIKRFFEQNIAPKIDNIKESFAKMGEALGPIGDAIGDVIQAIGEWFASIDWLDGIGKAFEIVGGIIVGVVTGVIAGAISTLVTMFEGAVQSISGAIQILSGLIDLVVALFTLDLGKAKEACEKILGGIVDLFTGLYKLVVEPVKQFVQGVIDWFVALWDELVGHSIVPDMINAIVEWFLSLPTKIFGKLQEFVNGVIQKFKDMWENVKTATTTKLNELRTGIMNAWNNIKSYFTTNIAPKFTLAYWQGKFDTIRAAIVDKLGAVRTQVMNSWNNIKNYFTTNIAPKFTLTYWANKFDTIRSAASNKLTAAKNTITNTWNTIKTWFSSNVAPKFTVTYWTNKFNTIKDGARAAFNGVISVVENAVNGIIRKINTLSWKIPDWVPKFGGSTFGFNLKTISIPRLATGGIALRSTLANIGENGREAILPLDNNTSWMDRLADRIAARNQTPSKIVLMVDGKQLGWAAINNINGITKQTGGLQLQLV